MQKIQILLSLSYHPIIMHPLHALTNFFVNFFGITQPTPKAANRAAWFIALMLLFVVAAVVVAGAIVFHVTFQ